jgi:ABC-type nitrate/sulfonate/bicarbonate transport system substrate-binding protein
MTIAIISRVHPRCHLVGVLAICLALAGCGSSSSNAPNRDATLLLDFTANAVHAGIFSAARRGYDEAEGVHLRVRTPPSGADATKLLLAGRVDFAVLDIHDLALARAKGRDIVGIMALVQRPLAAVLAQPSIRTPRDLEGHEVGVTGLASDDAVLASIVRGAGGDPARVHKVTIGFNAVQSLLAGRVAGATAFWDVEGVAFHAKRPAAKEFRVDDYGAPPYPELVLTTTRRTVDDEPGLVSSTVRALVRGYEFTTTDPDSSAQDLLAANHGLDPKQTAAQLDALDGAFIGSENQVGVLDPAALRRWAAWEARFGIVDRPPDVNAMFAPRFAASAVKQASG